MYNVYWMEQGVPRNELFRSDQMSAALTFMEVLRKRQRDGESVQFVTFSSENPNSVGHPGVDVTGPDYDWKKRRI